MPRQAKPISVREDAAREADKYDEEDYSAAAAAARAATPESKSRFEPVEEGVEQE